MKHFTKHIEDFDTNTTTNSQGYHGAKAAKTEAMFGAATSYLLDT